LCAVCVPPWCSKFQELAIPMSAPQQASTDKKAKPKRIITDPITNLRAHVEFLSKTSPHDPLRDGFDLEFKYVEDTSKKAELLTTSANLPINNEKNRYTNVKPPDFSRVPLSQIPGIEGSNYINANFIMGYDNQPNVYISAQGPLESTTLDFWRMIWEHKLFVILMLTKEVENGKIKSARYWPEWSGSPCSLSYGNLQVTITNRIELKDIVQRNFTIENTQSKETRDLVQIQYTGWLDHQAPPSVKSFMTMLHLVDSLNETAPKTSSSSSLVSPPICVHCSAGIGRSGTFCAIHIVYHFMKKHFQMSYTTPPINIVNTILQLRKQRPGMVQTKEQFVFVYQVIYEQYKKMKKEAEKRLKPPSESTSPPASGVDSMTTTTTGSSPTTSLSNGQQDDPAYLGQDSTS